MKSIPYFSSIRRRLTMVIVLGAIILAASLVTISVLVSSNILTRGAANQMNLFCEERGHDVNTELLRTEDAVEALSRWTQSKITDVDTITNDKELRDSIVDDADDLIRFMTEDNDFIQGAYIHYSLDITGDTDSEEGVYYTRDDDGHFKIIPFTQNMIEEDPVADYWYYGPIKNKASLWTKPYYDKSVEDYLISYVEPIYIDDTPVAIIGIDISFTRLLEWVDSIRYHDTGYMYLKEADGSAHYHIDDLGQAEFHSDSEDHVIENENLMYQDNTGNELIRYYYEGADRVMVYVTLRNGMRLVLCDNYTSIYSERDRAVVMMVSVSIGITILLAIVAVITSTRITNPLKKLTEAATEISSGNYDVILPPEKNNEVGKLSRAFRLAIDKIRAREEDYKTLTAAQTRRIEKADAELEKRDSDLLAMKNLAYVDSLTGVKNKTAYDDTTSYIDEQIKNGTAEFAVLMCDLNYLKLINDNLGHQGGDSALKRASSILCMAFPMSAVFRIGGDEFVVIPSGIEYAKLDEHIDNLKLILEEERASSEALEKRISISVGKAVYDREVDHSYRDVFERADKLMYEEKKQIHARDGYTGGIRNGITVQEN
ncbi:MAG: diguanylate cyclase [Clostridiales bacterium]|nr:diguanylate cyclase [Clostridiales bacterium]